jgi:hypothetical protein
MDGTRETTYGADSNTDETILKRLNRGWKPEDRAQVLLERVEEYAKTYKTTVRKLKIPVSLQGAAKQTVQEDGPRELQILEQVIQEGEEAEKIGAYESLVIHQIRNGTRDYIDDALDEVGHVSAVPKSGVMKHFNWRDAGHHTQLPGLRRSLYTNSVTDGAHMGDILGNDEEEKFDETAVADFNRDFSSSQVRWHNATKITNQRLHKSLDAWGSRVKPTRTSAAATSSSNSDAATAATASAMNLVAKNAPRCSIGCKNCYEQVEVAIAKRRTTEVPYDDWVRTQRLANKQAREHRPLRNTQASGFGVGHSPESSTFGSPRCQYTFSGSSPWDMEESRFGMV